MITFREFKEQSYYFINTIVWEINCFLKELWVGRPPENIFHPPHFTGKGLEVRHQKGLTWLLGCLEEGQHLGKSAKGPMLVQ